MVTGRSVTTDCFTSIWTQHNASPLIMILRSFRVLDLLNVSQDIEGNDMYFSKRNWHEVFALYDGEDHEDEPKSTINFPLPDDAILKDQV